MLHKKAGFKYGSRPTKKTVFARSATTKQSLLISCHPEAHPFFCHPERSEGSYHLNDETKILRKIAGFKYGSRPTKNSVFARSAHRGTLYWYLYDRVGLITMIKIVFVGMVACPHPPQNCGTLLRVPYVEHKQTITIV